MIIAEKLDSNISSLLNYNEKLGGNDEDIY